MPIADTWDWPFLYYAGTVILKMSPGIFWRTSPRKLDLLIKTHIEMNKEKNKSDAPNTYIDKIF
jgi:hypothetical protein